MIDNHILDILRFPHTFVGLLDKLEDRGIPAHGGQEMAYPPHVILWAGIDDFAARRLRHLISNGRIEIRPTSVLSYLAAGRTLSLPVVKGKYDYRSDHWLPVILQAT